MFTSEYQKVMNIPGAWRRVLTVCFYRAKNHGRLWRVNACVEYANEEKFIVQHIFRRFWKENSGEERL